MQQEEEWICTDDSQGQYCRKIGVNEYYYKDAATDPVLINLGNYTEDIIEYCIVPYSYTLYDNTSQLTNIHTLYGADARMIIAECIFEMKFSQWPTDTF
jgi:hypothetical protein